MTVGPIVVIPLEHDTVQLFILVPDCVRRIYTALASHRMLLGGGASFRLVLASTVGGLVAGLVDLDLVALLAQGTSRCHTTFEWIWILVLDWHHFWAVRVHLDLVLDLVGFLAKNDSFLGTWPSLIHQVVALLVNSIVSSDKTLMLGLRDQTWEQVAFVGSGLLPLVVFNSAHLRNILCLWARVIGSWLSIYHLSAHAFLILVALWRSSVLNAQLFGRALQTELLVWGGVGVVTTLK